MLHVSLVKGPPTDIQYFDDDDLAKRLSDHDVEMIREIFNTPLTGSYNWDYDTANAKIRRLYELGKRFNWNVETRHRLGPALADAMTLPPPGEPEGFCDHPKWQALSDEQKHRLLPPRQCPGSLTVPAWRAGRADGRLAARQLRPDP